MEQTKKIWFDGKFVDWEDAKIHVLTHALHYGSGIFEGIRAYKTEKGPAIFRLSEHIDRFFYSASALDMEVPFSKEEIVNAVLEIVKVNEIEECYIRPIVFFGYGKMGLNPKGSSVQAVIAVWPWGAYLGDKEAIRVKISKYIRIHPKSTIADAKITGHYVNSILAFLEIQKAGFDEALLLDYKGYIAEGPGENIFIIKNKKFFTPCLETILAGITRDSVIKIAKDLGFEVEEKKFTVEELKSADEAFFSGTAVEICPIGQIDETLINQGNIGEITQRIKEIYSRIVRGKEQRYLNWLTFVKI